MQIPQDIANTIVDPYAYQDGKRIDDAFSWLRANAPLAQAQPTGFNTFWAVTRHADIQEIERQNDLFHNGDTFTTLTNIEGGNKVLELTGGSPHLVRSLVQMDNPDHMDYRRLTQAWFLPQNLRKLEGRIREIARGFVDRMASMNGKCDFARDVAFLYPLHVIMEVIGVPEADEGLMLKLTQELFGAADPELNRSGTADGTTADGALGIQQTVAELMLYFTEMSENRRRVPKEDLATVLATATIRGEPLDHFAALSYYIIAATAGHDTTSNTTAGAMWAMLNNPEELAKVKADPSLIPGLVEESIRWVTPVKHFMRSATADCELGGQKISKGDWIMLCYPSGNRDDAVFKDPFKFDIQRTPNKHVAFGYGAHVCLGQHLGRMEMRILWEELLPRLDSIEWDGEPKNTVANFVCGPKAVPVRYKMN
jgi:cytochrome P450